MKENERDPIEQLTSSMFRQVRCRQRDALTVFIPDGREPSPEVKKYMDAAGSSRWYPQDGGNLVKFPNIFESYDEELFQIEKGSWNHEHCDRCGATIDAKQECWIADVDGEYCCLFCTKCFNNLKN